MKNSQDPETDLRNLKQATPARIAVGRAGTRAKTNSWIRFRNDHAAAKDAVLSELSPQFIEKFCQEYGAPVVQTGASDRQDYILHPPRGKSTSDETIASIRKTCSSNNQVQIVICDGLSALAVEATIADLLPMLQDAFKIELITCGVPILVKYGRVAIADQLSHALGAKLAINLIGERPGLSSGVGLSAYMTYNPGPQTISSDRTVVSNIHARGTPPVEAGAYIVHLAKIILEKKVSGVALQKLI